MATKSVIEIVEEYCTANGYDGLAGDECGCGLNDRGGIMPCEGFDPRVCQAAYKHKVPEDLVDYCDGGTEIYAPVKVMDWDAVRKDRDKPW